MLRTPARPLASLLAPLLALTFALSACGGGDDSGDAGSGSDRPPAEEFAARYADANGMPIADAECFAEALLAAVPLDELVDAGITSSSGRFRVKPTSATEALREKYVAAHTSCIDPYVHAARDMTIIGTMGRSDVQRTEELVAQVAQCFKQAKVSRAFVVDYITTFPDQDTPDGAKVDRCTDDVLDGASDR